MLSKFFLYAWSMYVQRIEAGYEDCQFVFYSSECGSAWFTVGDAAYSPCFHCYFAYIEQLHGHKLNIKVLVKFWCPGANKVW